MHLAQINIARLRAPIDDPSIVDFVNNLDGVNALAEASPGFVWRLKSDSGNATDIPFSDDPLTIVNMSVWTSVDALREFTYKGHHLEIFRRRPEWFEKPAQAPYCLWWISEGHLPTVDEARERLEHYRAHGATSRAFWFSQVYEYAAA